MTLHYGYLSGFGSVAKYVAVSTREAGLDVASMAESSTKVFVLKSWVAPVGLLLPVALRGIQPWPPTSSCSPRLLLKKAFLAKVKATVDKVGYVIICLGGCPMRTAFLADAGMKDAFGHTQLGGVAPPVDMIKAEHG